MGRILQLCLATLIVLTSFPHANNQARVFKSESCFHENEPCSSQNVTCSDDERIVILDEQHAFSNGTTICNDSCALECCQEGNFQCFQRVSGVTFSRTFSSCWNKTSCQYTPLKETRVFTDYPQCSSGSSLFGVLKYSCTKESSIRDFTDPTPAVGNLLMAVFSASSRVYPTCVHPNTTLQCRVEPEQGDVRVMLVMNHSTPGNCSKLHFTAGSYTSPDVPCSNFTEYTAVDNFYSQTQHFLKLQLNSVKDEAWAVVQSAHALKMTCGQTCSITTPVPPTSSPCTPHSSTENTSQPVSTPVPEPDKSTRNYHGPTEASQSSPNVPAITGGVVGSIIVIFIVVVIIVIIIRRQRAPKPKAAAREPEQGHAVVNSAYDDWDLDSGDGEGGTANGSSPSVLPPKPAPAQRPVTDVYAKVNKKSSRVTSPPSPANTGPQPGHLPTCPPPGEVTDVYSRPKKGGKKHPDEGDNSTDVTGPEDASSPPVIPPRHFRSSEATGNKMADGTSPEDQHNEYDHLGQKRRPTPQPGDVTHGHLGNKMADNNTPEDQHNEYDHLGQKRRPTPQPGDVAYGHLGNKMAAEDPEASYDRLRSGGRGGGEAPGPAVLGSHVYGQLGTEGATEEGDKGPYDRLGGADRHDVMKDGVYHVASDVDTDPYSEHEPNIFEDD